MASSYFAGAFSTLKTLASVPESSLRGGPSAARIPPPLLQRSLISLADIDLRGGRTHTEDVVAFCGGAPLQRLLTDNNVACATWYRVRDGAHFEPLPGTLGGSYSTCMDDVGSRILCRVRELANSSNSGFGEVGPIIVDPVIYSRAQLDPSRAQSFVADIANNDGTTSAIEVRLSSEAVEVWPSAADSKSAEVAATNEATRPSTSMLFSFPALSFSSLRVLLEDKTGLVLSFSATPPDSDEIKCARSESSFAGDLGVLQIPKQRLCLRFSDSPARDVAAIILRRCVGLDLYGRDSAFMIDEPPSIPSYGDVPAVIHVEELTHGTTLSEMQQPEITLALDEPHRSLEQDITLVIDARIDSLSSHGHDQDLCTPPGIETCRLLDASDTCSTAGVGVVAADKYVDGAVCSNAEPINSSALCQIEVLQRHTESLVEQLDTSKLANESANAKYLSLSGTLKTRDATIVRLQQENATALERSDLTAASSHARVAEIKRLTAQLAVLASESAMWKQRHVQSAAIAAESAGASSALTRLQREIQVLAASSSVLRTERDAARMEARESIEKLDVLRTASTAKDKEIFKLKAETETTRTRLDGTLAERDAGLAELKIANAQRNVTQAAATAAEAALAQSLETRAILEKEASALRIERDDLHVALQALTARCMSAEADASSSRELMEAAAARSAAGSADLDAYRAKVAEQSKTVDFLAREKIEAAALNATMQVEVAELRSRSSALDSKLKRLALAADASKSLQETVAALQNQVDDITAERNAALKKAESLRRDVARMTTSSEELKTLDIGELVRAKRSLEEKVVRMSADMLALNDRLDSVSSVSTGTGARGMALPPEGSGAFGSLGFVGTGSRGGIISPASPRSHFASIPVPSQVTGHDENSKVRELQRLANSLLEQLSDSADALKQQRAIKEALAARIHELERHLAAAKGDL